MNRAELAEMLTDQTPCARAREALLAGGSFEINIGAFSAFWHLGTWERRLQRTQKSRRPTVGLAETVDILRRAGQTPIRRGHIWDAGQDWTYMLSLDADADADATTVLAVCAGVPRAVIEASK